MLTIHNTKAPVSQSCMIAAWVDSTIYTISQSLDHMDTTLSLAEAKIKLIRNRLADRREQRQGDLFNEDGS